MSIATPSERESCLKSSYGIKEEYFTDLLRDVFERWRDFKYEKKNS